MKLRQWLPALGLAIAAPAVWAQAAPTADSAQPADAQTIARDPVTGRLRAPTSEEAQELARQRPAAQQLRAAARTAAPGQATAPLMRHHRGGASSVRLTEDFASHVVVTRDADGKLQQQCLTSKQAADEAINHTGHDHAKE